MLMFYHSVASPTSFVADSLKAVIPSIQEWIRMKVKEAQVVVNSH